MRIRARMSPVGWAIAALVLVGLVLLLGPVFTGNDGEPAPGPAAGGNATSTTQPSGGPASTGAEDLAPVPQRRGEEQRRTVQNFAAAWTRTQPTHQAWLAGIRAWVTPQLAEQLTTIDPRLPRPSGSVSSLEKQPVQTPGEAVWEMTVSDATGQETRTLLTLHENPGPGPAWLIDQVSGEE